MRCGICRKKTIFMMVKGVKMWSMLKETTITLKCWNNMNNGNSQARPSCITITINFT